MAKDAKGHGSNPRGKVKVSATQPAGYTVHDIGPGGKKTLAASGTMAQGAGGQVVHAKDSVAQDRVAAEALASGPKSASLPVHDAMTSRRVNEALGSMSRLRETFRAGDNRHGQYGRNVREAFERHAKTYAELTGKKPPHIYD